ncbi:hypothetical protein O181_129358 [Austropuccinia psidii MF-1]|uniref:Uncharacterized protein n=1 Tax=Austropuccinia psidii MF-1 TaxID=1389203 RepID=A0A9Q3KY05_9BASI|nr:hypothetical protein [Austropuccinia psidii MF-1]
MYGIDLHNKKDRYFTIGEDKNQKFAFLAFKRQIAVNNVSPVNLQLEKFKSEQFKEAEISLQLTDKQENEISPLLYDHRGAFASDKVSQGLFEMKRAWHSLNWDSLMEGSKIW